MGTFFIIGSFWFWTLIFTSLFIMTSLLETAKNPGTGATITMAITFLLLYFFGNSNSIDNIINYISHNPLMVVLFVGLYLVGGVAWSFGKWYFYLHKLKDKGYYGDDDVFKMFRGRITSWMCYWPLSMSWTVLNQPVRRIFDQLTTYFGNRYQKMAMSILPPRDPEDKMYKGSKSKNFNR